MILPRVIPSLLLSGRGLVKGVRFRDHTYVGDPINVIRIFNCKSIDELLFLDITATRENRLPPIDLLEKIADECLMPFAIGGGIRTPEHIHTVLHVGAEKVCIGSAACDDLSLVPDAAGRFGSQSIMVSIDVRLDKKGHYRVVSRSGTHDTGKDPVEYAIELEKAGVGEILLTSIDRDGTMAGYDIGLIRSIARAVAVPVIACGGAGNWRDLAAAVRDGDCQAAAAGSLFVFHGPRRAVLVNYPSADELSIIRQDKP